VIVTQRQPGKLPASRSSEPVKVTPSDCAGDQRPNRSHPNSEVNRCKARIVLGWGTAWEVLRVLLAFICIPALVRFEPVWLRAPF
jgi:hypothetical protein